MATREHLVLIPGAGSSCGYWEPLRRSLAARGAPSTAVELACEDESATLTTYAQQVARTIALIAAPVCVVAHSFGGFTAGLVPDLAPVRRIVLLAAMIPAPGESAAQWWQNTGQPEAHLAAARSAGLHPPLAPDDLFYNGLTAAQREVTEAAERSQAEGAFVQPWPRAAWPQVPTAVVALAEDRVLPPALLTRVAADRLGATITIAPGGHMGMVSHPDEVAGAVTEQGQI